MVDDQENGTTPEGSDDAARRVIDMVSDAFNVGLVGLLRQVIKGQLAMGDAEEALARVRSAVEQTRKTAKSSRAQLQLTMIDLVETELAEQMAGLRALVQASDSEDIVKMRIDHLRQAMIRHSSNIGRMQDAQAQAVADTWEPILQLVSDWRLGVAADPQSRD